MSPGGRRGPANVWAAPDPRREATGDRLASVELKLREVARVRPRSRRTKGVVEKLVQTLKQCVPWIERSDSTGVARTRIRPYAARVVSPSRRRSSIGSPLAWRRRTPRLADEARHEPSLVG